MKKIKQYGISLPSLIHDRMVNVKKDKGINLKRIIKDALDDYKFNERHVYKEFDYKFITKANIDIDIETYKEFNNIKAEYGVTLGHIIICAIDDFV